MDSIDRNILRALWTNADLTSSALGQAVGLSPSAAHRRVQQLEAEGMIRGYRARLSPAARGDPSTVFVMVTLKDQTEDTLGRFETALHRCPEVLEANLMSGEFDYLLKLAVRADDSFERLHRDTLARLPGVQRLVSHFSIRTVVDAE
ncbi:Lrp/AsnC family transcriptional regulator [Phenylobacterium sp. LjRoot225]|uniref:Lrp/AsnC family transcriptional regulator n=1 Tax=Phenylobacterium sp. LjRoot225 TaxID=3342285 RepID=UPI003ECDE39B